MRNDVLAKVRPVQWFSPSPLALDPAVIEFHVIDMNDPYIDMFNVGLRVPFLPLEPVAAAFFPLGGFFLERKGAIELRDAISQWTGARMKCQKLVMIPANWFTSNGSGPDNYFIHASALPDELSLHIFPNKDGLILSSDLSQGRFSMGVEAAGELRDALTRWIDALPEGVKCLLEDLPEGE